MSPTNKLPNRPEHHDRVADIFAGKTVLITGVTGFVGKVLLEKLLRACVDIKKIVVFIRSKNNVSVEERLENLFKSSLFELVKSQRGKKALNEVVVAVQGDIAEEHLGLSAGARHFLVQEVQIVYHSAAQLRFDETLKASVLMNVRGTKSLLDLAKSMQKLQLFCHVSSAYCHPEEDIMYEQPYHPPIDPLKLIKVCENENESDLSALTHKILDDHPNTYCFSKALSEGLINIELAKMPIILLRPSLVLPALKEPIPGWTDTINGTVGFQIAAGKGILRTIHANVHTYPDLIPVDVAANAFLCAAYDYLKRPPAKRVRNIYNLTSSAQYKVSWKEILDIGQDVITDSVPLNWVVWYPGGSAKSSKILHNCVFYFQHVLPSVMVDFIRWMFNYPPVLLPIYRRIQKGFDIIKFYHGKPWNFDNAEARKAREELNAYEREKYNVDAKDINYYEYFKDCTLCARRYILNEPDETLPRARQHMKFMYALDKLCTSLIFLWFGSLMIRYVYNNLIIFTAASKSSIWMPW